jgi:DNA-directed RNA polymerase subunit RPC12/RpoP
MTGLLDGAQIDLTCPHCRKKFKERIGRLKNNPLLRCPGCGGNIQFDASGSKGLAQGVKAAENATDKLRRSIGKIGK